MEPFGEWPQPVTFTAEPEPPGEPAPRFFAGTVPLYGNIARDLASRVDRDDG